MKHVAVLVILGFMVAGCMGQKPQGDIVLTVSGTIGKTNVNDTYQYTMDMIRNLPYTTITTPDPHLEATIEYGGVLLKDILSDLNAENIEEINIIAKDGYTAVIKVKDLDLGILIAYTADGEDLTDESGGPLKIIFSEEAQRVYAPENWVWWITKLKIS
jgi:hypothetical protein